MISAKALEKAIWKVARAWVGGPTNDVEVREITRIAREVERRLSGKYHKITAAELAAAASQAYYSG